MKCSFALAKLPICRHRGSRRAEAYPPTSDQDRASPAWIRPRSAQLRTASAKLRGRRVSVLRRKHVRDSSPLFDRLLCNAC
jgi:hypothetical protein